MNVRYDKVHKNRGKDNRVLLVRTDIEEIQMKTKTKIGPVDHLIASIPKEACVSRLENWRKLLKADPEPRPVRFVEDDCGLMQAELWVAPNDPQEWDMPPLGWKGCGWVPFHSMVRV